jgi:dTDP-4-amino-4,6-dideoxygalactose transaminase
MIPLAVPNLAGNEARYLQECIESTFVSSVGPFVTRFEEMVARAAAGRYAVATSAGTTGLHAALTALGVGRDDLVILQALTFIASANAIAHCGATPWLCDVAAESWTMDAAQVARLLQDETEERDGARWHTASGRRVAAIMPVYTLGMPADMDALMQVAHRYRLPVVADAAAALGALYKGRAVGDLGADLTVFSFNGNKTVTAGGGGVVAGNDEALCRRVRHLTTTARCGAEYDHDMVGFNYRMTNLQAAVGCAQLEQLEQFVASKRRIARRYNEALGDLPGVGVFPQPSWGEGGCWFSGITVTRPTVAEIMPVLRERGVDSRPFWKPIHLQVPYAQVPRAPLPVSERVWRTILTLPCSTGLTDEEQESVIAAVRACLNPGSRT